MDWQAPHPRFATMRWRSWPGSTASNASRSHSHSDAFLASTARNGDRGTPPAGVVLGKSVDRPRSCYDEASASEAITRATTALWPRRAHRRIQHLRRASGPRGTRRNTMVERWRRRSRCTRRGRPAFATSPTRSAASLAVLDGHLRARDVGNPDGHIRQSRARIADELDHEIITVPMPRAEGDPVNVARHTSSKHVGWARDRLARR